MKIIPLITAAAVWGKAWPILVAILFFGLLIFFHELGHFVFAKLFKVKVNEFAMGMGPTLLKKTKGETTYALRLLPIGGFVSMEGEDEHSDDDRAFCNRPVWQRIIIVAAGGTVNLIMGIIIVAIMLGQSDLIGTPRLHSFKEGSTSAAAMQELDNIKKINGRRVFSEFDLGFLVSRDKDGKVDFVVEREGERLELDGVPFTSAEFSKIVIKGVKPSILTVGKYSVLQTVSIARIVWVSLFDLVAGQYGVKDISGPIGTVAYVSQAAQNASEKRDNTGLLTMMALIAVNIGLFNLLPVPALDGGRLFFMLIELIFRKPIPQKLEVWVHAVGFVLLIGLMIVVSFSDIINLVRR